ncbi:penicillin-binding protein 2 [Amylibacter sp. SFDW26]|uniref:penicillin-binding protein 2 n=1 Tax=Amylibacter sp. SFDW26 TaxID=2652722 RepID=UPI001261AC22|nr:penicillin-binding protein 2 [Amylibacter sp. SFDW26]KAB7613820.1 penicillin-binding protein 2 [Amylibacter sp. SFDW26]
MRRPVKDKKPSKKMSRRAFILMGAQIGFMGILALRMRQLGIKQSEQFRLLAEENRINLQLVPPTRGLIYDRRGRPIAINIPIYRIQMVREQASDPEEVLRKLSQIVPLSEEDISSVLENMSKRRPWVPVTVTEDITWEHVASVAANAPSLPGISPIVGSYRQYPEAHEYSHILGYVGPVSDYDLSKTEDDDPLLRIPRFQIGKNGVETRVEKDLRGKAEIKRVEVNSRGRVMREIDSKPGEPGKNLQLTVDNTVQKAALDRIGEQSAAAVVVDVRNGDILALASAPTYDPNKFVTGISVPDWQALNENKYRPLANKAVSGTYPPGSTYKMIVALAALEAGVIKSDEQIRCLGHVEVFNRRFHCWKRGGHGRVDLARSLRESCDVYYYDIAQRVGIEKISEMARRLGLGTRHDLPLPAIREGLAPTKAWKQSVKGKDWFVGDTLNAGIGQGFTLASPLQLAVMTARLSAGTNIQPRLINTIGEDLMPIKGNEALDIDPEHLALVRRGMFEVVNHRRGTARGSRIRTEGMEMAGKTGTSQVRFITKAERARGVIRNEDLPWERRDHALFVGFAPYDNPKYALSVIVEHGGGGSKAAAPIARDIMLAALERDKTGYGPLPSQKRRTDDPDEQTPIAQSPPKDRA